VDKATKKHKQLRAQNKIDLIGLYMFTGILLLALIVAVISITL